MKSRPMEIDHSLFVCSTVELKFRDLDLQDPKIVNEPSDEN